MFRLGVFGKSQKLTRFTTFRVKSMFCLSNSFLLQFANFRHLERLFWRKKIHFLQIKNRWPLEILNSTCLFQKFFWYFFTPFFAKLVIGYLLLRWKIYFFSYFWPFFQHLFSFDFFGTKRWYQKSLTSRSFV